MRTVTTRKAPRSAQHAGLDAIAKRVGELAEEAPAAELDIENEIRCKDDGTPPAVKRRVVSG